MRDVSNLAEHASPFAAQPTIAPAEISRPTGPPIAYFASAMGIASLGLAWRGAVAVFGVPADVGEALLGVAAIVFIALAVAYLRKAIANPASVAAEYANPLVANYFGTVTISLSLFAAGSLPYSRPLATSLWVVSATASVVLLLAVLERWISTSREQKHMTPALFIPVVGNAVAVYAAVPLGFREAGWFLFAAALLCWLTLSPLVFYRLFFQDAIPRALAPSLAVLVSSPAVLASAWYTLEGDSADPVFRILAFKALFLGVLVAVVTKYARGAAFSPAWWGYLFPAAAVAGAFVRYASALRTPFANALAIASLIVASAILLYVTIRTIGALRPKRATAAT